MPAPESQHPLFDQIRRQQRWMMVNIAAGVIVTLIAVFILIQLVRSSRGGQFFAWLALGVLLMTCLPLALTWRRAKRQKQVIMAMVDSGQLHCPKCQLLVEMEDHQARCRRCGRMYEVTELRQFWNNLVHNPLAASEWLVQHQGNRLQRMAAGLMFMRNRGKAWPIVLSNAVLWIGFGVVFGLVQGRNVIAGAFTFLHMFLVMTGFMLIAMGRKARVGSGLHCARCEYEQGPNPEALRRCPECGLEWNRFAGTVRGRRQANAGMIVGGIVLGLLGVALIFTPLTKANWQLKILPTGALISEVTKKKGFTMAEWAELRARTLSPEQEARLATALFEKRRAQTPALFSPDEDNWFVAQIMAGTLPPEQKQRYYREMLDVELIAPTQAKVGEPITLDMKCTYRGAATNNPTAEAYIGGYFIGDDPEPLARQSSGIAGIMLDPRTSGKFNRDGWRAEFTPRTSGALPVKLRVWVIYIPLGAGGQAIQWQPDGTPLIVPAAVWHELREVERTIDVTE